MGLRQDPHLVERKAIRMKRHLVPLLAPRRDSASLRLDSAFLLCVAIFSTRCPSCRDILLLELHLFIIIRSLIALFLPRSPPHSSSHAYSIFSRILVPEVNRHMGT